MLDRTLRYSGSFESLYLISCFLPDAKHESAESTRGFLRETINIRFLPSDFNPGMLRHLQSSCLGR